MLSSYGVAGRMFKVLSDHNINIEMIQPLRSVYPAL